MEQADVNSQPGCRPDTDEKGRNLLVRWILPATVAFGFLGDLLLRQTPYGLNAALWAVMSVGCATALIYGYEKERLSLWTVVFLVSSGLFALCLAWRDGPYLNWLAGSCWLASVALVSGIQGGFKPTLASFLEYTATFLRGVIRILTGGWFVAWAANPREWRVDALRKPWVSALLRGVLLAIPILIVFGALFASADQAFHKLVSNLFSFDLKFLTRHIVAFALSAWAAAGILVSLVFGFTRHTVDEEPLRDFQLGGVEAGIVMGAVDALFLAFVVVQFQYFFGGSGRIESVAGLTYSEYARHGFFELCAVAALTLLLQYMFHWLMRYRSGGVQALVRGLSLIQLLLVAVIMVSALMRMNLYVEAYGLTQLRFYSSAFMGWIGISLVWFAVTALRGHAKRFMIGMVGSGLLIVLAFHVVNPAAVIVSWNLSRVSEGKAFDAMYALTLGADAIPALAAGLNRLPQDKATIVWKELQEERPDLYEPNWRTWNWSRARAESALEDLVREGAQRR